MGDDRDYHSLKPCDNFLPLALLLTLIALLRHGRECWKEAGRGR